MKISTKGRYALRLMIDVAINGNDEYVALKDISARQEVSVKYLEQIVSILGNAGFLKSIRGSRGGYKLSKEPKDYTIGDIIRVTEGSLSPIACLDDETNHCPRAGHCATLEFWQGLNKVVNDYADSITLQDIVEKQRNKIEYNI